MSENIGRDETQEETINRHVFEAIGHASMCWNPRPTGIFDSTEAKKVGEDLIDFLNRSGVLK